VPPLMAAPTPLLAVIRSDRLDAADGLRGQG
jgi:hypothetical protein